MSFKVEVQAVGENSWHTNGIVLSNPVQAQAYGQNLWQRWTGCEKFRVIESDETPNYRWDFDVHKLVELEVEND